jgi:sugar O-acyltransferase (sialic acid O-acetyltransferase NeuD family)
MKNIAIVGASGHGKVVAELAELCGYNVVFFDDAYSSENTKIEHWSVKGCFLDLLEQHDIYKNVVVAIGSNEIRSRLSERLEANGFILPVLIHPKAEISRYATVDIGSVVFANSVINAFAKIGKNCIINTSAVVEHDCILGDGIHLSPNVALSGGTVVNDLAWLGIGSVTRQLIKIGKNSTVGANSTVVKDIPAGVTVFGSPAKVMELK